MSSSSRKVDLFNLDNLINIPPPPAPLMKKITPLNKIVQDFNLQFFNDRYTVAQIKKEV